MQRKARTRNERERRLVFGANRRRSGLLAVILSVGLVTSGLSTFALLGGNAAPASAAPGNPGTPSAGAVVYAEDFQNVPGPDPILRLPQYTGATGQKYTANTAWLTNCNGWIVSANQSTTAAAQGTDCTPAGATPAQGLGWWNVNQQLAQALGVYNGQSVADARSNYANSAFTGADPGAGKVEFQTASNIPFTASNRFIAFSVDVAAVFCSFSAPLLQFQLLNSAGVASNVGSQVNGCTNGTSVTVPSLGSQGPGTVNVKTVRSNAAVLFSGSSVGVRMLNNNGSGSGNDHAIDNVKILDVTPQLDKAFSPTNIQVGQTSKLTFTVTNTSELAAKNGWSFTDNLPNGLTLASPTAAATTCPAGAVTAAAGGTSIAVTGNLSSGMTSCTITVNVTAASQGTYTNGPANVTETGLNPPGDTTLIVAGPVVTCATDPNIFNTGFNAATGGILPDNAKDANWQVASGGLQNASVSLPPSGAAWAPANVGNMAPGAWSPSPFGNAQWVSQQTIASPDQGGPGDWYYRYQFTIDPTVDPANFALAMNFMADNMVAEVYVNGVAQSGKVPSIPQAPLTPYVGDNATGSYNYPGFVTSTAAQTTLTNDWKTGANTLIVQIKSAPGMEGFDAQVRPSVLCPQPSYTVAKSASTTSTTPGGTVTYTVTVKNTGNVAYTAANPATFTDNLSAVLDDASYNGDASGGATVNGRTLSWSGPLAVGATTTITYSVTVNAPDTGDHVLTNAVTPGTNGGSCDPAGVCATTTPVQSLTITKTANSNEVVPGDTITYTITVQNTGKADYTGANPASFSDDLSAVLDDAAYNNDATSGATYAAPTLSWSGPLAVGATQTITYSVTVNNPDTGDAKLTNAVVSTTPGANCQAGSNDPACTVLIPSGSFTVAKSASAVVANPGDKITYTVTVTNTGSIDYTAVDPASFSDSLAAVLDDATYNNDVSNGATVTGNTLSWAGPLAVGASTTITYSVTVNDPDTGDKTLTNTVRPTSPGGACTTPGDCTTTTPVRSYTVAKTATPAGAVAAGSVITYTVTVTNTGTADYTGANPAKFTDNLSAVLDDATYNNDASNGATYAAPTLSWSGPLAAGASTAIIYSVTVGAAGSGDGTLKNAVVPTGPGGDCAPGSCTTTNEVQAYTVTKTSSPTGAVNPGTVVTYTVTVKNTGTADYTGANPAKFTDNLSAVLDDATYNNDASNGATYAAPTLSWSGPLAAGASTAITYSVTVNNPDAGDHTLTNAVVPTVPGGECETAGDCTTTNPVQSYTTAKSVSATQANPGDVVTYTVTVTNTGQAAYTATKPASFTDNLTAVLDDATYNGDASNGATVSGVTLSWAGPLAIGQTITITYSVTVKNPDNGDHDLGNTVTPNGPGGACATPGACATITPIQSYTATKTADTNVVNPGGVITYTVTLVNTGKADYTAAAPATFTDDLSGVLDDATYNNDATAGAIYAAPTLSWSGPLAAGQTITITYSVTVNDPDTGDSVLPNTVVTGVGGNCEVGSNDPACSVIIPSGSYTVSKAASSSTVDQGGKLTYTVTVKNTGQVDYTAADPASFTDDLSAVLDDATYNGDASNGATVTGTDLTWSGPLAAGATITITYSVTVKNADAGDKVLNNFVRPTSDGGSCTVDCATTTPVRSLLATKTVDSASTAPGKKVTYTITLTNTGKADYTAAAPATFTDNLSAVLDDATYNKDATAGATYTAPVLSWAGPLAMGATQTVTYSVTVDNPDRGDHVLKNAVITPGGTCVTGTEPGCSTTTKVTDPNSPAPAFLADTGIGNWLSIAGISALALIAAGLGIAFSRRRRNA